MNHQLEVNKIIEIAVSPILVWRALTDRDTIKKYFFGTEAISDWQPGSSLVFKGEWEGKSYEDKGNIHMAVPGKLLVYDYWTAFSGLEDTPENYSIVSYNLDKTADGTKVSLTQKGFAGEEEQAHADGGWTMVLQNLKELLESK